MEIGRHYLLLVANSELESDVQAKLGASDLVQETFLEAQRDFVQFHGTTEAELLAWFRRILLNNLANETRRYRGTSKRQLALELPIDADGSSSGFAATLAAGASTPSEQAMKREETQALERALERLPEPYREVILLRQREHQSFEEIGRHLDRTADAARMLWSRALERLAQELEPPHES